MKLSATERAAIITGIFLIFGILLTAYFNHTAKEVSNKTNSREYIFSGTIVDQLTHNSIPGAQITVVGSTKKYISEDNGNFIISFNDSIPSIRVRVISKNYIPYDESFDMPSQGNIIQLAKDKSQ